MGISANHSTYIQQNMCNLYLLTGFFRSMISLPLRPKISSTYSTHSAIRKVSVKAFDSIFGQRLSEDDMLEQYNRNIYQGPIFD